MSDGYANYFRTFCPSVAIVVSDILYVHMYEYVLSFCVYFASYKHSVYIDIHRTID